MKWVLQLYCCLFHKSPLQSPTQQGSFLLSYKVQLKPLLPFLEFVITKKHLFSTYFGCPSKQSSIILSAKAHESNVADPVCSFRFKSVSFLFLCSLSSRTCQMIFSLRRVLWMLFLHPSDAPNSTRRLQKDFFKAFGFFFTTKLIADHRTFSETKIIS